MSTYKEQIIKNALAIKELVDQSKSIDNLNELLETATLNDYIVIAKRNTDSSYSTFKTKLSNLGFGSKTTNYNITQFVGEQELALKEGTPPLSGIFSVNLSNYVGIDYSNTRTSLTEFDIIEGAVLGGHARINGIWSTKPTFNGATEAVSSLFVPNVNLYMYIEKWVDGIVYWFDLN